MPQRYPKGSRLENLAIASTCTAPFQVAKHKVEDIASLVGANVLTWADRKINTKRAPFPDYKLWEYKSIRRQDPIEVAEEHQGTNVFAYKPLLPNDSDGLPVMAPRMRLVTLLPGKSSEHIRLTLSDREIDNGESYEILSVCSDSGPRRYIECNGLKLGIVEDVWYALQELRSPTAERVIWTESISTNGEDVSELNNQALLLKCIVENAQGVVVWLGRSFAGSHDAFGTIRQFEQIEMNNSQPGALGDTDSRTFEPLNILPETLKALDILFWQPWFSHVRSALYVSLASSISFRCGPDESLYTALERAAYHINSMPDLAKLGVDPRRVIRMEDFRKRHSGLNSAIPKSIVYVLSETRNFYSDDPRNKVYDILTLTEIPKKDRIIPDYHAGHSQVFEGATHSIIKSSQSLDILSAVKHDSIPGWPSYVANWKAHRLPVSFYTLRSFKDMFATGNSKAIPSYQPLLKGMDTSTMSLTGMAIDAIQLVGEPFLEPTPVPNEPPTKYDNAVLAEAWASTMTFAKDAMSRTLNSTGEFRLPQWEHLSAKAAQHPPGDKSMDAFIETITAGQWDGNKIEAQSAYSAAARLWRLNATYNGSHEVQVPQDMDAKDLTLATEFLKAHRSASYDRRFFITKCGYMGIGSKTIRRGDIVALLHGGKTPYLLRKRRDRTFEFLNECYIQGMMNGEEFDPSVKGQIFLLR